MAGEETEVSDGDVFWGILPKLVKVTRLDLRALDGQSMALQMMPLAHFGRRGDRMDTAIHRGCSTCLLVMRVPVLGLCLAV